jgi:hypothetical protein
MIYELISILSVPSIPMTFSSHQRANAASWIFYNDTFAIVIEEAPLCVEQTVKMMKSGSRKIPPCIMQYQAAASVFYRKSRNPHGPSGRPIFVAALEHTQFTTEYEPIGFIAKLLGRRPRPLQVFVGVFHAEGRRNHGSRPNDFTSESARDFLLETAANQIGLRANDFVKAESAARGPASPEML